MLNGYHFTGKALVAFVREVSNDSFLSAFCYSGYDFGYLLKVLTCSAMPADEADFFELLRLYFPCIYDIKYLMRSCKNLKGGLQDIADDLQVQRIETIEKDGRHDNILRCRLHGSVRNIKRAVIVCSPARRFLKCGKCFLMIGLMIKNTCKYLFIYQIVMGALF